ncbi:MAG: DMT family transporter [Burkholderiales bacterium]|nr:DMT family transporter [Burkholderiales bacterium]GIK87435.1 MAG: transporter [Betaproteobacteria bacterium]
MAEPQRRATGRALVPVAVLALVWGLNWPILKLGVTELPPLTFRGYTLAVAGLGLLAIARASGESIRVPRALWPLVVLLALFNITGWNGLVLFGVQQMPAGRSAILAYTMPVWATLVSLMVLHEPIGRRKALGLLLGMAGMLLLLGEDLATIERRPFAALMILGAAFIWACGTVLLRKHKPPLPQNTLTGWMMIVGWAPLAAVAPLLDPDWAARIPSLNATAWFAILYNIVLAGTIAHWAWFTIARTLPVAVSSLSSLPVPVVGVFAGMLVLGERPGWPEWAALALVVAALVAVMWPAGNKPPSTAPASPED